MKMSCNFLKQSPPKRQIKSPFQTNGVAISLVACIQSTLKTDEELW